jgi:hypothetical protein
VPALQSSHDPPLAAFVPGSCMAYHLFCLRGAGCGSVDVDVARHTCWPRRPGSKPPALQAGHPWHCVACTSHRRSPDRLCSSSDLRVAPVGAIGEGVGPRLRRRRSERSNASARPTPTWRAGRRRPSRPKLNCGLFFVGRWPMSVAAPRLVGSSHRQPRAFAAMAKLLKSE